MAADRRLNSHRRIILSLSPVRRLSSNFCRFRGRRITSNAQRGHVDRCNARSATEHSKFACRVCRCLQCATCFVHIVQLMAVLHDRRIFVSFFDGCTDLVRKQFYQFLFPWRVSGNSRWHKTFAVFQCVEPTSHLTRLTNVVFFAVLS